MELNVFWDNLSYTLIYGEPSELTPCIGLALANTCSLVYFCVLLPDTLVVLAVALFEDLLLLLDFEPLGRPPCR